MTDLDTDPRATALLRHLGPDPTPWVRPSGADHDVVVVGAGQAGIGIGFALRRAGIGRVSVVDAAAPREAGVWTSTARMHTLRTPKAWPEPEFGIPGLSFRAWFEERHGLDAYEALDRIGRLDWAAYLAWVERTLRVPVRHRTRLVDVAPTALGLDVTLEVTDPDGTARTVTESTRALVLANGVEGTGGPAVPTAVRGLPSTHVAHTGDRIDFDALAGRRVAVLGAAASALDAAGVALESGADEVHLYTRREQLIVQGPGGFGPPNLGNRDHYHRLDDAERWRQKVTAARQGRSATLASLERALAVPGLRVHLAAPWHAASIVDDRVRVEAADGVLDVDFVVLGTGYQYDPRTRPELAGIADEVALWGDRVDPPADLRDETLAVSPYLGAGFELVERRPGRAPWLGRVHVFSAAAGLSFGYPVGDVQSLAPLVPRLVDAVSSDLWFEDRTLPAAPSPAAAPAASYRDRYDHVVWTAQAPAAV